MAAWWWRRFTGAVVVEVLGAPAVVSVVGTDSGDVA
jgi:hypothetical protein